MLCVSLHGQQNAGDRHDWIAYEENSEVTLFGPRCTSSYIQRQMAHTERFTWEHDILNDVRKFTRMKLRSLVRHTCAVQQAS